MRPSPQQIADAVGELGALRYFPSDESARVSIMRLLQRMVATPEQLRWLVETMIDRVGEWKGPLELRGVFCSRWHPADGVEADCAETIGFRPQELEMRSLVEHEERKLLGAGESAALLPSLRRIQ